jgi:hypothetical protein
MSLLEIILLYLSIYSSNRIYLILCPLHFFPLFNPVFFISVVLQLFFTSNLIKSSQSTIFTTLNKPNQPYISTIIPGKTNISVSMLARNMIMHYISRCLFSHALIGTSLCVLRTHIESRFCNPHVVLLLN